MRAARGRSRRPLLAVALLLLSALAALAAAAASRSAQRFPNVLIVTVDTLRADRLSAYGYGRRTTPNLDRLLASGARFAEARTVEPLTNPAMCSLFTSLYPHEHGATRNGMRMRPRLPSLATTLTRRGYRSAAFVGNWTLRDRISGLGEHFDAYEEVFTRKRWLGVFKGEATADDLTDAALEWLAEHREDSRRPFLLWVHYVEPHAPYRLQEEFAGRLGVPTKGDVSRADRYDTEIAFADHHVGRLLAALDASSGLRQNTLVVFTADHGESLGEHNYWGHGRNLYEPGLRIPLGISWPGRLRPEVVEAPALLLDVAPTVLGLAGLPAPRDFRGFDWTPVLLGESPPPRDRVTWYQAHRGAVLSAQEAKGARLRGLLEVAVLRGGRKEVFRLDGGQHRVFDLTRDPGERHNLAAASVKRSAELAEWMTSVRKGLAASDAVLAADVDVDPESVERLRALGYVD